MHFNPMMVAGGTVVVKISAMSGIVGGALPRKYIFSYSSLFC